MEVQLNLLFDNDIRTNACRAVTYVTAAGDQAFRFRVRLLP